MYFCAIKVRRINVKGTEVPYFITKKYDYAGAGGTNHS